MLNVLSHSKLIESGCDSDDITLLVTHILLDGWIDRPSPLHSFQGNLDLSHSQPRMPGSRLFSPRDVDDLAVTVNNGGCGEEMNRGQEPKAGTEG